jgi:hypothetical protein
MHAMKWLGQARCREVDPELFFPTADSAEPAYGAQAAVAKRVCAVCPVRGECLAWAIQHLPEGIAGGVDAHKRRGMRQAERRGAHRRENGRAA